MIFDCTECFYNKEQGYLLCEKHKPVSIPFHRKYDQLYADCKTELYIPTLGRDFCVVSSSGRPPPPSPLFDSDLSLTRSDIQATELFEENIKSLKKWGLLPEDKKQLLQLLRDADKALASFDFNGTFETDGVFEEEIDMKAKNEWMYMGRHRYTKIKRIS